ncbi:cytochrome P460 family protein [Geobacter sp.]|uniref:cytochrome P460 family protein n=1 Tax=Geobacter sp. TaxID=46610 RepID=UPI00262A97A1|nr:cytochrome P460 family protein [Geobacter sp.]
MKRILAAIALTLAGTAATGAGELPVAPNGIAYLTGYRSWEAVAPSYRDDKGQIRLILGNPTALKALREGTRPFPDGATFAKLAWNAEKLPKFPVATVPGPFAQVEFMVKDGTKFKATGGWGFARFVGKELRPYGKDPSFVRECFGCHTPVKDNDFIFTHLATVP